MPRYVRPEVADANGIYISDPPHEYRLSHNENGFDFPAELKAEVVRRVGAKVWSRYPTVRPAELAARLAEHAGVEPAQVVLGNGSAEIVSAVVAAAVSRGDHAVIPVPTYPRYRLFCQLLGATAHLPEMTAEDGFALPTEEIIETVRRNDARLICLNTPNNPTGVAHATDDLMRIAGETDALVLIDAAYLEFSEQDLGPLLGKCANVIVTRSFSKAWSLAGLRIGYGVMPSALAEELHKIKLPFTPDIFSEQAALVALEHAQTFTALIDELKGERERVFAALSAFPALTVYPSAANFLLVRTTRPSADVTRNLLDTHGILVADLGKSPLLPDHVRISIGARGDNDRLIAALAAIA